MAISLSQYLIKHRYFLIHFGSEQFGQRVMLKCDSLKFRLQAPIEEKDNASYQVIVIHFRIEGKP